VTRIRLLAASGRSIDPGLQEELGLLASEAEDAVFALQDLARGIYPSVLTDRGLPSALRAEVARVPCAELTCGVADGSRLPPDVEAALYFVALEALGNAQKHAPEARVAVHLVVRDDATYLEIEDDGPGFGPGPPDRPGGLQNMADRMAAVDGSLVVDLRGAGARIVARTATGCVPAPRPSASGPAPAPVAVAGPPAVSDRVLSSAGTATPPPPAG
jgi:signal transduction histidine kinase